jgi:hypothetical protein
LAGVPMANINPAARVPLRINRLQIPLFMMISSGVTELPAGLQLTESVYPMVFTPINKDASRGPKGCAHKLLLLRKIGGT